MLDVITTYGDKSLSDIAIDDTIYTVDGKKSTVLNTYNYSTTELFRVIYSDDRSLPHSIEDYIYTDYGNIPLRRLMYEDFASINITIKPVLFDTLQENNT